LNLPEDVAFDAQGRMYVGNRDRNNAAAGAGDINPRIERVTFANNGTHTIETWVSLDGGGPLDMRFDARGHLLVSSWEQGLISIDLAGVVDVIVRDGELIDGKPYSHSDGIAIARDGRIFHTQGTDAATDAMGAVSSFAANSGPGRLIVTDPRTRQSRVLIDDLSFGNGIALAPDESYVLVADQIRYRILRHWLTGPDAGKSDVWMDNLPGMPHNLFVDDKRVIWVALNRERVGLGDTIRASPFLARQALKLPGLFAGEDQSRVDDAASTARGTGSVLALDFDKTVRLSLQNPPMRMNTISTAVPHNGYLYLGTITGGPVLRYLLPRK
jgi:hypothetical protein